MTFGYEGCKCNRGGKVLGQEKSVVSPSLPVSDRGGERARLLLYNTSHNAHPALAWMDHRGSHLGHDVREEEVVAPQTHGGECDWLLGPGNVGDGLRRACVGK